MPDVNVFAAAGRWRVPVLVTAQFLLWFGAGDATAAAPGKVYFFATRDACVASGAFAKEECVAAFLNATAELQDRAPRFSSGDACRARFHICELRRDASEGEALAYAEPDAVAYSPVALGVEMVSTARGVEAAPTLAVETPAELFPKFPVSRPYGEDRPQPAAKPLDGWGAVILPADHFQPFPKLDAPDVDSAGIEPATARPFAVGALEQAAQTSSSEETPAERRARLRAAPFIE